MKQAALFRSFLPRPTNWSPLKESTDNQLTSSTSPKKEYIAKAVGGSFVDVSETLILETVKCWLITLIVSNINIMTFNDVFSMFRVLLTHLEI